LFQLLAVLLFPNGGRLAGNTYECGG